MLPKDYIAYRLTGVHCTDVSDASGMLLFDVKNRCWSKEMCEICGVREEQLATCYESYEKVGCVLPEVADELGLPHNVVVAAGAGDNAAAAVGTGTVGDNMCNISLGTSGTILSLLIISVWIRTMLCILCTCRRSLSSYGLHAKCCILQ